jgi:hypothetical protein
MKVWKYHPNTYDDNLEKRHDANSAINIDHRGGRADPRQLA